jgi:hypothetical protein
VIARAHRYEGRGVRRLADPFASSLVALVALGLSGLGVLVVTWRGVAADVRVYDQVPFLASGGITGLALIGFACGALVIQHRRWQEARRRADLEVAIAAAAALLASARRRTEAGQR